MREQYVHIDERERRSIERLLGTGKSVRKIAERLGRSVSSISEEVSKRKVQGVYTTRKAAHKAYVKRKYAKKDCLKIALDADLKKYVGDKLQDEWSPELIAGRLKEHEKSLQYASTKAIYKFIYSVHGRKLERFLPSHMVKKKGGPKRNTSIWEDGRISIEERPKKVLSRKEFGHFEGDFIESGKDGVGSILVLVERKTRFPYLRYCTDRSTAGVNALIAETLKTAHLKSLTFDNDISLKKHKELSVLVEADVFFCHPQSPHEKGTVENRNKAIRRYIPKKSDISQYQNKLAVIETKLRSRPMKCLHFNTPMEVWEKEMQKQALKNTARIWGGIIRQVLQVKN